jgi:3-hydroxybutyryl-CoA dehydrogenase
LNQVAESAIKNLGIVGAGQMGLGIAQVAAQAGIDVQLLDADVEFAKAGRARLEKTLDTLVAKGRMSADDKRACIDRIHPVGDYRGVEECEFVIEAAPEREELKRDIFKKLNQATDPSAILASNTSSISITMLGSHTTRPDKVIGMHFMNPVPLMKLVEIVRGLPTDDQTYGITANLAQRLGKTTIVARDIPGFIVNRVLIPLLNEACYALYEGLGTAEDIDTGVRLGLNHPMGPLELADLIGLDTCLAIARVLHEELGDDKYRPCPLLRQHVAAGWLGRKTSRGFYSYDAHGQKQKSTESAKP